MGLLKFLKNVGDFVLGVIILLVMIGFLWFVGKLTIYIGKSIWGEITKPQPVCHWEWVDSAGNEGISELKYCRGKGSNIYCGTADEAHLVVSVKKVCETTE